jgi:hypothetical protein
MWRHFSINGVHFMGNRIVAGAVGVIALIILIAAGVTLYPDFKNSTQSLSDLAATGALISGGSNATAVALPSPVPTAFMLQDRGSDTGHQISSPVPTSPVLNMQTAEAASMNAYNTAIAIDKGHLNDPLPPPAVNSLPDCSTSPPPCSFNYSDGPGVAPSPVGTNLDTGGVNTGSEGNPQKDTDQGASFNGDKP